MILSISLTATTSKAVIRDTKEYKYCFDACPNFTDWNNFLLIEIKTHKEIMKDALGYKACTNNLSLCNQDLKLNSINYNKLQQENFILNQKIVKLENPAWYNNPLIFGATGLALGSFFTILAIGGVL